MDNWTDRSASRREPSDGIPSTAESLRESPRAGMRHFTVVVRVSFVRSFVRSFFLSFDLSEIAFFEFRGRRPSAVADWSIGRPRHTHTHTHTEGDKQKPTENEKKKENGREREKKKEGAGRRRGQSARLIGPSFIYSFIYVLI